MRKIRLNNKLYELVNEPNRSASNLQFNVDKGLNTFDQIIEDADGNDIIEIYEDDEKVATYTGYAAFFCASYVKDQGTVSIELLNSDMQSQINSIDETLGGVSESLQNQSELVDGLREDVNAITPYTETKAAYFNESEKTFYNVPEGNVSVFFDNYNGPYSIKRIENRLIVSFDVLRKGTNITISIQ